MGTKYICRSIMSRDIIRCSKLRLLIITLWREGAILSGGSEQVTRHLPEVSYILFSKCSDLRGSEQPAAFQEGIETSSPPGAKEGCQGHLAVGALP